MAIPSHKAGRVPLSEIARKGVLIVSALTFGLLFPALVLLGGSTNLINWGPGLLLAGIACLLLLDQDRHAMRGGGLHSICVLLFLGLLLIRARYSPDVSAAANNSALISLAAVGYFIGKLAGVSKSRALFIGLSLVSTLNLSCSVVQMINPEWNLIYPHRSAEFPSGLFAHYNYSTAFCLGTVGLLLSRGCSESTWLKPVMLGGAACALATIPISLSRGGNLALALMVATGSALLLARAFWNSKSMMSTWLPVVVLLALLLIFGGSLVPLIGRDTGLDDFYADSVRFSFWAAAIQISTAHPWLGGGAGSFAWNAFHVMDGLHIEPGMAHNEALQLAVDYGYPALIAMAALIAVPVLLSCWSFVNKTDPTNAAWAALGLVAMLVQSNFESIFHSGPGAFIAALILGRISGSLWNTGSADSLGTSSHRNDGDTPDRRFLCALRARVDDYLAGRADALSKLVGLLSQSTDEQWRRGAHRLTYWAKVQNEEALRKAINDLGTKCSGELGRLSSKADSLMVARSTANSTRGLNILRNLALAGCAIPIVLSGARLSQALIQAWIPVYHPQRVSVSKRFELLLGLAEHHPGLGIDRKVLAAGLDCIYQHEGQEARESWATAYRTRILRAIPGWRTDPGAALQLAEIIGWAGNFESALSYYNHAISTQGNNESLFMAHAFKGQYLYELFISAAADGQMMRQKFYAQQAAECFQNAIAAMRNNQGTLDPFFVKMFQECEDSRKRDM